MSRLRRLGRTARDADGAVLVLTAVMLPFLIGFCGLAVDVGNWFEHRRHLQVQADAGVLAAAGEFRAPLSSCDDEAIKEMARSYSGLDYNAQVGGTPADNVLREFNSRTWPGQESPVDDSVVEGEPCATGMIDLKLTETDLPYFLKLGKVVPNINAHARVSIRTKVGSVGALPIGVPENEPSSARAVFVNETTGAVIASTPLTHVENSSQWSNIDAPVPVTINTPRVGVRIVLGGGASTTCGEPLVNCYDDGSTHGVVLIRGYSNTPAGTAAAPQVRGVSLEAGTCEDGYFAEAATSSPCTALIDAKVAFGTDPPPATTRLYVKRADANNSALVALTRPAAAGADWTDGSFPISRGDGPVDIELRYRTGCPINPATDCNGGSSSLGVVHRAFGADTVRSGPLRSVRVLRNGLPGANSFERCATCTHNLVVSIEVQSGLENASRVEDPIVTLKLAGGGSQNQSLGCGDSARALSVELIAGCDTKYRENDSDPCVGNAQALWGTEQPWPCVAVNTGASPNEVAQGLNTRFMGSERPASCTSPNNWLSFPDFPRGDPRIVEVFLTPFGAFTRRPGGIGAGNDTVPVTGFATFYITGWSGQGGGFDNPCAVSNGGIDDNAPDGSIVGHFIKYIDTLNNGGAGEEFCDFDAFGRCVAVLER